MIFDTVAVSHRLQQPQAFKLAHKTPDGGIGGVAEFLFQLLGGEGTVPVGREFELPKGLLLLRHPALGQGGLEVSCGVGGRKGGAQLVVDMFDEVDQKRGHIQHPAQVGVPLRQCVGAVVGLAAFFHIAGQRNEQGGGVALLHQIPQVEQAGHSAVAVEPGMQGP